MTEELELISFMQIKCLSKSLTFEVLESVYDSLHAKAVCFVDQSKNGISRGKLLLSKSLKCFSHSLTWNEEAVDIK